MKTSEPKSVEGEWEEEFERSFRNKEVKPNYDLLLDIIKSLITTLLHSEREKWGIKLAKEQKEWHRIGFEDGRAEERERIVKMCEEMKSEYKTRKRMTAFQDTLFNHAVNVLDDLHDKLSNK